jgi:hypothetical protein
MRTLGGITKMHNGIDLVPANGQHPCEIVSVCAGRVVDVISHLPDSHTGLGVTSNQRGNFIVIETPDKYRVWYMHLKGGTVRHRYGETVKAGQFIGVMGTTGQSTGIHLHYEIRDPKGYAFNPAPYIGTNLLFNGRIEMTKDDLVKGPVEIDGKIIQTEQFNLDGTIVFPLRGMAELFGFAVTWEPRDGKHMPVIRTK